MVWSPTGNIKGPAGSSSTFTPVYGAFPDKIAAYKSKAQAPTAPVKFMVLSDSTSDGYIGGGINGGSTTWDHVWPQLLMKKLRDQQALGAGGDGWIPPNTPTWPGGYDYLPSIQRPANYTDQDMLNFQIGIPGALWLQPGHASKVYDIEYPLSPGTTAVDIVTTGYGGNITVVCANSAANTTIVASGDRKITRIVNPGASVRIYPSTDGFALLGIFEFVGDESKGFRMMNFAQASIQAAEVLGWLQDTTKSTKPMIQVYQPDVCLIVLGSNDLSNGGKTPEQTLNLLGGIATEVLAVAPNCKPVFVMRPNPSTAYGTLTQLVKDNAAAVGGEVLDLRTDSRLAPSNTSLYVADAVHFTAAGDEVMASIVADYFRVQTVASTITVESIQSQIDTSIVVAEKPRRWASEVIINSGALVNGYNDNIGGVLVDYDILLTQASFRLSDPAAAIGGTGNLQIQWYAGSPTTTETTLIATTQLAAGQHDVIVTFATPVDLTINTVLRAKITLGLTTVAVPCHIQWRGRYK